MISHLNFLFFKGPGKELTKCLLTCLLMGPGTSFQATLGCPPTPPFFKEGHHSWWSSCTCRWSGSQRGRKQPPGWLDYLVCLPRIQCWAVPLANRIGFCSWLEIGSQLSTPVWTLSYDSTIYYEVCSALCSVIHLCHMPSIHRRIHLFLDPSILLACQSIHTQTMLSNIDL